jgi:hypothetical membrane protein
MDREDLIRLVRKSQSVISIILFFMVFSFCWKVTNFEITEIQLSQWGRNGLVGWLWNSIVCVLGFSMFITSILYIKNNNRIKWVYTSYFLFTFISLCLLGVGFFNINYPFIHSVCAWTYFFAYPLVIFLFTHLNRNVLQYKDWRNNLIISVSMIVIPLIFIYLFKGMAIAETSHILFVIIWNLKIALKND